MATTIAPPTTAGDGGASAVAPGAAGDKEPGKGAKSGGKKRQKLVLAIVVLLAVGGGAYKFVLHKKPAAGKPAPGVIVGEPTQTINLSGNHYLQVRIAVQLDAGAKPTAITKDGAQLQDAVLGIFDGQTMDRLSGAGGLAWARAHVKAALSADFPDTVYTVYFTQFVMQ